MDNSPLVSVVIPTLNSEGTIRKCLDSVFSQSYRGIEAIVVDKRSTDHTVYIASEIGAKVYVIDASERSEQKNHGARMSQGKYVYFIDSDFILSPDLILEAVETSEKELCEAIIVHNDSDPTISFWSKVRNLERNCYFDDDLNVSARFLLKKTFLDIGGFDEGLVACEDYEIHNRLIAKGYKICRIASREVHIGEPRTLGEIARKHFYYGNTLSDYVDIGGGRSVLQLLPIRPAFLRHWRDFLKSPSLTAGFIIYQITRYGSSFFGILYKKVT